MITCSNESIKTGTMLLVEDLINVVNSIHPKLNEFYFFMIIKDNTQPLDATDSVSISKIYFYLSSEKLTLQNLKIH